MKVLSLFDGISCGMVALERAGIPISEYHAYEIDKYAIQVSENNYPMISHHGDVTAADFTQYKGFDLLIGGSPCTYWSIAKNNRETTPDGIGGQLFMEYVRALKESECRYFLYENNYSIHQNIKDFISEQLGVQPIMINSALVSAQQRRRCYWTNIPNVKQPEDKYILLQDVLESGISWLDKSYTYTTRCQGAILNDTLGRHRHTMIAEPIILNGAGGKSRTIKAQYGKTSIANTTKSGTMGATMIAEKFNEAVIFSRSHGFYKGGIQKNKIGTLTANGSFENNNFVAAKIDEPCFYFGGNIPKQIYYVENCILCYKGKRYNVDLPDGYYLFRKLTPVEAERLQTLPDNYTAAVSNTQRYKCIGNGWTVDVIAHILKGLNN